MPGSSVIVVRNDFPRIAVEMPVKAKAVEAATAARVVARARATAPRRTGALSGSGSSRGGDITFSVRYAGYVEHGTRFMAAEAFLGPALDAEQRAFLDGLKVTLK